MLSRNIKRALLDSRWPMPPTFLLPWAASLTTVSHATESNNMPLPPNAGRHISRKPIKELPNPVSLPTLSSAWPSSAPQPSATTSPPALSDSVRELLPVLEAQTPHYIAAHLYDRPYLLTQGDTVRLPFFMKGVEPGDVLRLNRATVLGSREYTLKAAAAAPALKSPAHSSTTVIDPVTGDLGSRSTGMPGLGVMGVESTSVAPHFVPHIAKGKVSYIDERLFVCRAVVMGVESEPLRVKEKTKRRQRKIKKVKSKHRYTILRIKELRVRGVEEIDGGVED
ncbi:hypothetical protein LTR91_004278 [Friedmanniomyces endolithicus]|uniref:Large ribosomal subunit protein bL21m n=1 Tax=Friedmanniomyces endolithicus TaxID=329885 RepID=A0AAN6KWZ1_9PEZI|nr:hypothetical protein LTR94_005525 [Friedmanniomyces endolithicus]KAK0790716.1 hypothetical protein LTR38_010482 [Friedmanniomyces endolithicus]KAK0799228.1 hypothetical protein LTR59_006168 [Friedmanniomyces endolithicus]KAK0814636.1 hypothetical protein LTR75_004148 [Friedmanniomyces endolithicus]KAK0847757.1 hypothetical protein LTR03_006115 [Friedmanniomyces endolithicus]